MEATARLVHNQAGGSEVFDVGFRPVGKALFLTTSERARFKDLAVRFRMLSPTISDQLSPKEQERELKKATVTATTNPSITVPNHKPGAKLEKQSMWLDMIDTPRVPRWCRSS